MQVKGLIKAYVLILQYVIKSFSKLQPNNLTKEKGNITEPSAIAIEDDVSSLASHELMLY